MHSPVRMVDHPAGVAASGPQRHLERVDRQVASQRTRNPPPDDPPREHVEYATRIRQRQKRLDENEIERLIAEYRTGLTVYQLATRFGCHRTTVSECLKARGIQMRRRPLCEEQIIEAIRLYQSGLSVAKVADQVGAKSETVRLRLIERGVQMRDSRGLARKHQDSTAEKTQLPEER